MKRLSSILAGLGIAISGVLPISAQEAAIPSVRPGDFHCFRGMPESQINYLPENSDSRSRNILKLAKLDNCKYDNTDGHNLREITTEGDYRVLVVLVEFKDVRFTQGRPNTRDLIDDMLNGADFSYQNATGSANAFYRTASHGKFNPIFDVVGPVYLDKNEIEYVTKNPDDTYSNESTGFEPVVVYPAGRMVEQAVAQLDDEVDFSKYDSDKDGYVDFIYFFFAGKGATTGGGTNRTIWPHAFTLTSAIGAPVEHDGVLINRYATSAEIGQDSRLSGIGTFCHEFGHVLGFPDLYDTANNNGQASKCFTPGSFDCMDAGNYNNNEKSPAIFSTYEQYGMEWMQPVTITGGGHFTMLPLEAHSFGYKVNSSSNPQEYFLLENRGSNYYDQYLEAHGLLIWHIDFNLDVWNSGIVNNNKDHLRVDLIEADNEKDSSSRNGDLFPGAAGVCEFTSNVSPAFKDWSNKRVGYELFKIKRNFDSTIEFDIVANSEKEMKDITIDPPCPSITGVTATSLSIEWPEVRGAEKYFVSVFPSEVFNGTPLNYKDYAEGYCFRELTDIEADNGINSVVLDNLLPNRNYSVMLYAAGQNNSSRMNSPISASTVDSSDFENAAPNLILEKIEDKVIATWNEIDGADSYKLSVVTREKGAVSDMIVKGNFSENKLPLDWSGNGKFDNRDSYCGESAPSYRLFAPDGYLQTPIYDEPLKNMIFWLTRRKSYDDGLCQLLIFIADKSGNFSYWKSIKDIPNPGKYFDLDFPANVYGMRMVYQFLETGLDIYIDDIVLSFCGEGVDTPADAEIRMLDGSSSEITGLVRNTEYIASVTPVKDSKEGSKSREIVFTLENLPVSGVDEITGLNPSIEYSIENMTFVPADSTLVYSVSTIDGKVLTSGRNGKFNFPNRGIYLITIGNQTLKIKI